MKRAFSFNPSVAEAFSTNAYCPGTDIFPAIFLGKKDSSNFTRVSFAKIHLITPISCNLKTE
ncbi:hypothetical protein SAMN06265348_10818 [Pedobacter westerhofensis]|uniref:Uncharacterized protein n=1 Tax=Pedobacter westerhofensis TaxID=425512 RepID=A0A521EES7_9SPHI|nr:hypothetical protein SAMN06265348_10818 [Pedobacter westerhofensis]